MANESSLLSLEGISKDFYGNVVLEDVTFTVGRGEIIGLVGENGAGKTTLMRILFGMPVIAETGGFKGRIMLDGKQVAFTSPFDALDAGIGMVHQEFSLIPGFTATENITLNRESMKRNVACDIFGERMSVLDRARMRTRAAKAISRLGVKLDPDILVSEMPVGHKQFTEIAREIDRSNVKLLVLDEPTAVLTETEAEVLIQSMRMLAAQGISIIFISHRLHEIINVADKIVVLRDGKAVKSVPVKGVSVHDIATWMVGREVKGSSSMLSACSEKVFLKVDNLWVDMPGETVRNVSFDVCEGEIFGIGGLAGQGKLGIPNGLMGLFPAGGNASLDDSPVPLNDPHKVLNNHMAFVSEDRRGVGLLLDETLEWNVAFTAMQAKGEHLIPVLGGLFKLRNERTMKLLAEEYIKTLEIKCTGPKQRAKELSGGNQQKICLAKAFALKPKLLFVSEPTRGIDVGAKAIVLETLRRYNKEYGMTIVMVSSELEELRSICHRIAIVDEGRIAGILPPTAEIAEFGLLMSGEKTGKNGDAA
ncbi:MAG: sugar ABC transporter ATP-binding protein [Spirochaetes bacterium GWD1_61_31]|nr:MAG: sugar ABC transporter ATP-binding protein [Spirochaetes bacterium GWB1_60_80]OHD34106.1 MAG: sugar ABC transporter ATP-binding protein [Spirochaetes bacterium GWC1_61_12]OHD35404.1 MAG: sugar ABC transporter ATP-binding protein [Spirochaetes bacterium GWD1_61_31]OHD44912.1 MAG: sugar ABC transporter ATP-binding protein [Spirochaetes bacterium GWE1_60_18]OHD60023.1 MAG: sugar ABC transporter ATP-binding protein [Spirochaetes bacterium GWF1_60_12]HAP43707.1 sugar ABC transporter ATP-bind